jgi:hypothetical protein
VRSAALMYLMEQMDVDHDDTAALCDVVVTDTHFGIHPFYIRRGSHMNISCFLIVGTNMMWLEAAFAVCSPDKRKHFSILCYVISH